MLMTKRKGFDSKILLVLDNKTILMQKYLNSFSDINILYIIVIIIFISAKYESLNAQIKPPENKTITAYRTSATIKIDAKAEEPDWSNTVISNDFYPYYPKNDSLPNTEFPTRLRMLYDDSGIYIYAEMFDPRPDSILRQVAVRDEDAVADQIDIRINPFNDAQQDFIFLVSAAGVQIDGISTLNNGDDYTPDAVWESKTEINSKGWVAEIKIPYSALRFPKQKANHWSMTVFRNVQRRRFILSWNFIDRAASNPMKYAGQITGIDNISTPKRLFLTPYASTYYHADQDKLTFKAGADLKLGISDNFTLDAILIPDFGQTSFDEVQYVLGPFEQKFLEKRAFFTEGIDLFSKGDIVYTRRIGQIYNKKPELKGDEDIIEYPGQTNLLNAFKFSGRTAGGLGIGVMNAMTGNSYVTVKNNITGDVRKLLQSPFTNYNVAVADMRYGKGNSISLINTNVIRYGSFNDANVGALLSDNYLLKNKYEFKSALKYSHLTEVAKSEGVNISGTFLKVEGKHNFGLGGEYMSKYYDPNDFGIQYYKDYTMIDGFYTYRLLNSTKRFNSFNVFTEASTRVNNTSSKIENAQISARINSQSSKNNFFGIMIGSNPLKYYDHYEPRVENRYMRQYRDMFMWLGFSPNYNKKFIVEFFPSFWGKEVKGMWGYELEIDPRWRINDHMVIRSNIEILEARKEMGFVDQIASNIIVGQRNQKTLTASLNWTYNFNSSISLYATARYYLTAVKYNEFFSLGIDGEYYPTDYSATDKDLTYNNWNFDFSFNWWYAPGSQLTFLYRNSLEYADSKYDTNISHALRNFLDNPKENTFSLRLTYFLDYNYVANMIHKNKN